MLVERQPTGSATEETREAPPASRDVIVVSGLPRSGTSMMMRILEAGGVPVLVDEERRPDVDNPNGYYEYAAVKRTRIDPSWVPEARGKAVKMVYRLVYDLPRDQSYRVVFMRRNLDEVLASQRKMLERLGRTPRLVEDPAVAAAYAAELARFERWIARQRHVAMLDMNYQGLVSAPSSRLEVLAAFVGRRLDVAKMGAAIDPALHRNRLARVSNEA